MSETSVLSPVVARLPPSVRKVQLIHTNYALWSKLFHRDLVADAALFAKFDAIGCVGTIGARQFEETFPACRGKVFAFHNVIAQDGLERAGRTRHVGAPSPSQPLRLISLARINDTVAKDGLRMIRVAKRLKEAGVSFVWDNYGGGGNGFVACQREVARLGIEDVFRIHPYDPRARERIAEADLFVLLSHYEGLPNVIYESFIAGTPVFATAVGGIPEQIQDGVNGWLVEDDEDKIVSRLCSVLGKNEALPVAKSRLVEYVYDNERAICGHIHAYFDVA